jgi:predicted DNA-binding protein (UPF0251 family)/DNA-directed RNA polymerase subunit RPC12/RpoP
MPRPHKPKLVSEVPRAGYFKPRGIPVPQLEETVLRLEELEALRLVDLEGLYQEEAATCMGVSRQTLQRMLEEARKKVVDALVHGKALKIGGGSYILREEGGRYRCGRCGGQVPPPPGRKGMGWRCPSCDHGAPGKGRPPGKPVP